MNLKLPRVVQTNISRFGSCFLMQMWNPLGSYADAAATSNGTAEQQASAKSLQQVGRFSSYIFKEDCLMTAVQGW
jgi:hypothetical protein